MTPKINICSSQMFFVVKLITNVYNIKQLKNAIKNIHDVDFEF